MPIVVDLPGATVRVTLEVGGKMGENAVRFVSESVTELNCDQALFEKDRARDL